ncbi:MAG: hypothetical protein PVJ49_10190 [Acidobacteriota bacterium]|jgi:hypothetical protein
MTRAPWLQVTALVFAVTTLACGGDRWDTVTAPELDPSAQYLPAQDPAGDHAKRTYFTGIEVPLPPAICALFDGFSIDPMGVCSNHWFQPVGPGRWHARGRKAIFMDLSAEPRMTGLQMIDVLANFDDEMSGPLSGKFLFRVGEFSALGFVPEPGGGTWEGTWHGRSHADGGLTYQGVGRGRGGSVDGLQAHVEGRFIPSDPPTPIQISGYIFDPKAR